MFWNSAGCAWAMMLGSNAAVANPSSAPRLLVHEAAESCFGCCHADTTTEKNKMNTFSESIMGAEATGLDVVAKGDRSMID